MSVEISRGARGKRLSVLGAFATVAAIASVASHARSEVTGFDPFGTESHANVPPVTALVPQTSGVELCAFDLPVAPLRLKDVAARALCQNPLTRRGWANAQLQTARLGEAKAAEWPTLSGVLNGSLNRTHTSLADGSASQESSNGTVRGAELAFEWVVFDFGARSAEVRKARELVSAADQSFDATVLDVLYTSTRDYFAAVTARAQVEAAREAESNAIQIFAAAHAQMQSGVASLSDELQARTACNQATLGVVKANSAMQEAIGTVAIDMGLSPDVPIVLEPMSAVTQRPAPQLESIRALLDQALENHPRLLAARAELRASEASIDSMRAQAMPSVRLEGGLSASNRPAASFNTTGSVSSASRSSYVGIRLTIPFFDGFSSTYRIREARAEAGLQQTNVAETEQQVALNVWKSYEAVRGGAQTVEQTQALKDNAGLAFDAAQARYKVGISGILELLRAQDVLAAANQQYILALSDWLTARLGLAASLGKLDFGQIQED